MDVSASFSPMSFFVGLAAGVVLTLFFTRRSSVGEHVPPIPPPVLTGDLETDLRPLVESGHKIEAIKLVRKHMGCGLKEAKDMVDDMERRLKG